jgi:predicted MFS family arabinose efflux permease
MLVAEIVQGLAQAIFGLLVLTGNAQLWAMMVLTALRGIGFGFYFPAAQGLLPQTVEPGQLSSANAMVRLSLNGAQIGGAAFGGLVVAVIGPGWGLIVDASSYGVAALLRVWMRLGKLEPIAARGVLHELRDGWQAFVSRRWLWSVVVQAGLVTPMFIGCFTVLGPAIANSDLGGAGSWGVILAANSVGAVLGAALMLRYRPRRLLLSGSLALPLIALPLLALVGPLATGVIAATALVAGVGIEVFSVNWSVALQQEIPAGMLSRVSAYDALGSYALAPVGALLAGPVSLAIGTTATLVGSAVAITASAAAVISVPEIRHLERRAATPPGAEPSGTPSSPASGRPA